MSTRAPQPLPSPSPYEANVSGDPDAVTGEHDGIASVGYVKRKQAESRAWMRVSEFKTAIGLVVVSVATAFGVFFTLEARGQTNTKAQLEPIAAQTATNTADIKELKGAVQESALRTARIEVMVEMSLRNQGIRPPPKVELDAGTNDSITEVKQ
jgi:hypothetical protein